MAKDNDVIFESTRIPIDCSINLRFDRYSGFERHYAANISMGGMFIRTNDLHPPGTAFDFSFALHDEQSLIKGTAEVLWRRAEDRGPNQPSGLGVRFLTLDLDSKYVIYSMVDRYIQVGGTPFDLGSPDRAGTAISAYQRSGFRKVLRATLAAAAVLADGGLIYFWLWQTLEDPTRVAGQAGQPSAEPVSPPAVESLSTPSGVEAGAGPEPGSAAGSTPSEELVRALESAVAGWVRAWTDQDVGAYLSCYSANFRPASGMSHAAWKAERRARLTRPGPIEVSVLSLEIEQAAKDRAVARFDQVYSSPTYRDRVRKALELVRQAGEWKIVAEEIVTDDPAA